MKIVHSAPPKYFYIDPGRDKRIHFYGGDELWSASPFLLVSAAAAIAINICISLFMIFLTCQLQKYLRDHQVTIEEFVSLINKEVSKTLVPFGSN